MADTGHAAGDSDAGSGGTDRPPRLDIGPRQVGSLGSTFGDHLVGLSLTLARRPRTNGLPIKRKITSRESGSPR